jgi:hypothetical protein
MYTSREGVLSNGRRFEFHGADSEAERDFTLEQLLEGNRLIYSHSYDFIIQEETVEAIMERMELEPDLWISRLEPDIADIVAYYFSESNDILFWMLPVNTVIMGRITVWSVNHESGVVSYYAPIYVDANE